jgi:hypothetical protein
MEKNRGYILWERWDREFRLALGPQSTLMMGSIILFFPFLERVCSIFYIQDTAQKQLFLVPFILDQFKDRYEAVHCCFSNF